MAHSVAGYKKVKKHQQCVLTSANDTVKKTCKYSNHCNLKYTLFHLGFNFTSFFLFSGSKCSALRMNE